MEKKASVFSLLSLMLVIFLDGLGQGIVFPIFSKVLFDPHSSFLQADVTPEMRNIWYGILIGAFFICWFIGAAVLSDLSDTVGRKKALIICLGGSAIGNFLSALAFTFHSVWILLLGRIIVGLTNGSQPIAQASIVDNSPKEKLGQNLGFIVMALFIGLVGGPLVGGFLSDSSLVFWFINSTPLYFAGILAALNIIFLLSFYHETSTARGKVKIKLDRAIQIFISAFTHKSVRFLSICYFFLLSGWSLYLVYISAYMVEKYALSRAEVSIFFAILGLGLAIGVGIISGYLEKKGFNRKTTIYAGYILFILAVIVTVFPNEEIWPWLMSLITGAGAGIGYAFLLSIFSNQVSAEQQGWVMGITSSLFALGAGLASIAEGFLSAVDLKLPLYVSIGLAVLGLLLFIGFRSRKGHAEASKA